MKYLIASDIHGSNFYAKIIDKLIMEEKPDKLILLGDLYYHGPRNPLPLEYNPKEVSNILNKHKDIIYAVKGNCDAEVDQMISLFKIRNHLKLKINNKMFMFTHGHKYNFDNIPSGIDVLVYGHFHTCFIKEKDNVICVNAGSITLPKEDTPHSYILIQDNELIIKNVLNEIVNKIKF